MTQEVDILWHDSDQNSLEIKNLWWAQWQSDWNHPLLVFLVCIEMGIDDINLTNKLIELRVSLRLTGNREGNGLMHAAALHVLQP